MARRIMVTGGAGFIGSHLCKRLTAAGNKVYCLDNFYTGSQENVRSLMGRPEFELIRHDITTPLELEVDEIYNLACPAAPVHYQADAIQTTRTNVLGALNLLELAKNTGARILQASTSEVYGDPQIHPQKEDYWGNVNPIGIRSCYDEGKRCAETLFFDYHRQYGVNVKVIRIFNTYGPNMHLQDGRVVGNFIVQALRGEEITVYGDGSQTRSFCYVDDLVEGMIRMMNTGRHVIGPVNLGNTGEISIRDLAEKVTAMTGSRSAVVYTQLPCDDPARRRPDISLARSVLGWEPHVPLEEGLEKTIAHFRGQLTGKPVERKEGGAGSAYDLSDQQLQLRPLCC